MNNDIAKILRDKLIEPLNWKDHYAGLVNDFVRIDVITRDGKNVPVRKIFPVSCDVTFAECGTGKYKYLMPSFNRRSVIYFEDNGVNLVSRDGSRFNFKSRLRLVVWVNMRKFNYPNDCSIGGILAGNILSNLPTTPFNDGDYSRMSIEFTGQAPKTSQIFSRYSYDEPISQYLLSPGDYFALNFETSFSADKSCFEEINTSDDPCFDKPEISESPVPNMSAKFRYHVEFYTDDNVLEYEIDVLAGMNIVRVQWGKVNLEPGEWTLIGNKIKNVDPNADTEGGIYVQIEFERL